MLRTAASSPPAAPLPHLPRPAATPQPPFARSAKALSKYSDMVDNLVR